MMSALFLENQIQLTSMLIDAKSFETISKFSFALV